jgi:hypothetical protein
MILSSLQLGIDCPQRAVIPFFFSAGTGGMLLPARSLNRFSILPDNLEDCNPKKETHILLFFQILPYTSLVVNFYILFVKFSSKKDFFEESAAGQEAPGPQIDSNFSDRFCVLFQTSLSCRRQTR